MNIKERAEKAVNLKHSGCNCCQAVTASFSDITGTEGDTLMKAASGFAGGMGCMEATCGALIGAVMTAGLIKDGKGTVGAARTMLKDFEKRSGATICKELKGADTGKVLCECDDCVRNAVYVLCENLGIK